ncbi:MAG: site-2 protease family protein [Deltaproteobacteria bacterium]|nr:site-2 protease family protein [Deltaproteobacteria bacterium]
MEQGNFDTFIVAIIGLIPVILSLSVHEFAHAWSAKQLGDDTATRHGRLTLNPIAHIDPIGTLVLPLLLTMQGLPAFGWAKPVPTDPSRYTRKISMWKGHMIVAAAGPISNLLMAIICLALASFLVHSGYIANTPEAIATFLIRMVIINIALFVFNMLPVAPLDGQSVLAGLLPSAWASGFHNISRRFGWIGLILIIVFAGRILARPVELIFTGLKAIVGLS